ncbi:MAG: DUF3179 domain-containing protein [Mariprofundus sp.]|nr:DUF3179 domain-containing protein [Mariprofundus sp.]
MPALAKPKVETANQAAQWMNDQDQILGVVIGGEARAYPIRILNWHEIVNDQIEKQSLVMTYCPLCGSGMAFQTQDKFGVSGLLYQSDVLLYDRKSESLWSQLMMQAVTGPRAGEHLSQIAVEHTSWKTWLEHHPATTVLSRDTGYVRDYDRNPYSGYESRADTYFPINHHDARLPSKSWVIGLSIANHHKAWSLEYLKKRGSHEILWHGRQLNIEVEGTGIRMSDKGSGKQLPVTRLYWFAWATFHPNTELEK